MDFTFINGAFVSQFLDGWFLRTARRTVYVDHSYLCNEGVLPVCVDSSLWLCYSLFVALGTLHVLYKVRCCETCLLCAVVILR